MRIDQPDEDGGRGDDADTPDANEARDADAAARSGDGGPERAMPAASADDAEVGMLHGYQREVTAKVPIPPGAPGIPDYP